MQEKLNKEKLLNQRQELLSTVSNMKRLLEQYRQEIEKIGSGSTIYASDNALNVRTSFENDYKKMKELLDTLTNVVEFLEPVANTYENLDLEIAKRISEFPDIDGGCI